MHLRTALTISVTILLIVCAIAVYHAEKLTSVGMAWIIVLCLAVIALLISINGKIKEIDDNSIPLPKTKYTYKPY